jgi:hypothetical protein
MHVQACCVRREHRRGSSGLVLILANRNHGPVQFLGDDMTNVDKRLDRHWKATRKSKSNPDYLSHAHLLDSDASAAASAKAGRNVNVWRTPIVRICDVSIGLVKSQESPNGDDMTFLHFEGQDKKLGLNSTNSETLENLSGSGVPRRWVGMRIQLYVDPLAKHLAGKKGPAIRIRPMLPKGDAVDAMPPPRPEDVERLEVEQAERLAEQRESGED